MTPDRRSSESGTALALGQPKTRALTTVTTVGEVEARRQVARTAPLTVKTVLPRRQASCERRPRARTVRARRTRSTSRAGPGDDPGKPEPGSPGSPANRPLVGAGAAR